MRRSLARLALDLRTTVAQWEQKLHFPRHLDPLDPLLERCDPNRRGDEGRTLGQILEALSNPEQATNLPDNVLERLMPETLVLLDALADRIEHGLTRPSEIGAGLLRVRLAAAEK